MPSQQYMRWHASPVEDEEFPDLGEELDTHGHNEEAEGVSNGQVITVLAPRRSGRFSNGRRRLPLAMLGKYDISTKIICLMAVSCALCITIGILIGYSMTSHHHESSYYHPPSTTTTSSNRHHSHPPLPFGGRDFRRATAVKFQSYLTSNMVNAYARRLSRIPVNQLADHVASTLRIQGYYTKTLSFSATLSTPDSTRPNTVEMAAPDGTYSVINQPTLHDGRIPFAVYSPAGEAVGPVVYAHQGSADDLATLRALGATLRGAVLLIRHASDSEAAQVARAQAAGAVGVLLYPDPEQFHGDGTAYPNGTGLPLDGVLFPALKLVPGDPSTVMYPSLSHVYKKPMNMFDGLVPNIPVQPISYKTAKVLLANMAGPEIPKKWRLKLHKTVNKSSNITHKTSTNRYKPSKKANQTAAENHSKTNLLMTKNQTEEEPKPKLPAKRDSKDGADSQYILEYLLPRKIGGIWNTSSDVLTVRIRTHNLLRERRITNVHAWLPAQDSTKVVHIGTGQGGGGGGVVGLASLLAIAESLAKTLPNGTGRTVLLSAWADSQLGWIGSTEFTELYGGWLEDSALAYMDIGSSIGYKGGLRVQASPLLHEAVREAAHHVAWPQQEALSVMEGWRMEGGREYDIAYESLGCSSDAVSFSAGHGIPAVQFSVARPIHPAACMEGDCGACYDKREEHSLSRSQYDNLDASTRLLDPSLDWTTAMASLVGVSSLVLSESVLPPADFKGDFSGSLVDGWWSFLHNHLAALNHTHCNFTEIVDSIRNELYTLEDTMAEVTAWYNRRSAQRDPYTLFRHDEDRVNYFLRISRRLLGPRGVGRLFSTTLVGPSVILEDPLHAPHSSDDSLLHSEESIPVPSIIQNIQTSKTFADSSYNTLAFSSSYREEDKPRPHSWFPQVSQALARALANESTWDNLHRELSLLLSALASFRNLIPLHG